MYRRLLLACAVAATLVGAAFPAVTNAHWVYTARSYSGGQEWAIHSPQGFAGWATTWSGSPGSGTMYGYNGTGYWIAVQVACQNNTPSPWQYKWKSSPDQTHTAVNYKCPSTYNAVWTVGAISE